MKTITVLAAVFALMASTLSKADSLGIYQCQFKTPIGRTGLLTMDLDTNEISLLAEGDDPAMPANWKAVYSAKVPTYCGYAPTEPKPTKCDFATQHVSTSGFTSKNLLCQMVDDSGNPIAVVTTGTLYLNTKTLDGTLRCSVYSTAAKDLKLSACQKK